MVREIYIAIRGAIVEGYANIFKDEKSAKNARSTIIILALVVVGFAGFHLYRYYIASKESIAQAAFIESVKDFEKAESGTGSWYDAEIAFEMAYRKNTGSKLAPYFLAYKAKALLKQDKKAEAITIFDEALTKMDPNSDIYWIYKTEFAVMKLGMKDEALQEEGLRELEKIACLSESCKKDNAGTASALFYLATYYWDKNDLKKAKEMWTKLAAKDFDSPYVQLAKDKLNQ